MSNCLYQMIGYCSYALEQLGLYEPRIGSKEAMDRLSVERSIWEKYQGNRKKLWSNFQSNNTITTGVPLFVEKAITHLENQNIRNGVAVDLGCGISSTTFNLLERGWKVYAVDNSNHVIKILTEKVDSIGKNWIKNGQLVLINQSIEEFKYPEKVHLILATESIPYCDPEKIFNIFLRVKKALLPGGVFVCSLFPYHNAITDNVMRGMFGAWMTTKNVVEAVVRSTDFSSWTVTEGKRPGGLANQFQIFAQAYI